MAKTWSWSSCWQRRTQQQHSQSLSEPSTPSRASRTGRGSCSSPDSSNTISQSSTVLLGKFPARELVWSTRGTQPSSALKLARQGQTSHCTPNTMGNRRSGASQRGREEILQKTCTWFLIIMGTAVYTSCWLKQLGSPKLWGEMLAHAITSDFGTMQGQTEDLLCSI